MRRVPKHLQVKVIKWFDYLWLTQKCSDEEKAVSCLPGKFSRKRNSGYSKRKKKIRKNLKMKKISNERMNELVFFSLYIFIPRDLHHFCMNAFTPPLISSHTCESRVKIHSIGFIFIFFFFVRYLISSCEQNFFYSVQTSIRRCKNI